MDNVTFYRGIAFAPHGVTEDNTAPHAWLLSWVRWELHCSLGIARPDRNTASALCVVTEDIRSAQAASRCCYLQISISTAMHIFTASDVVHGTGCTRGHPICVQNPDID